MLYCILALGTPAHADEANMRPRVSLMLEHDGQSSWTELLRSGLQNAARDFNLDARVVIAPAGSGQRDLFQKTAAESDLVLVASDNLHEALRDNAANYRHVKFGSIDAGIRAPNIMSVTFADEQAAFLAGAVAAMLTKTRGLSGINAEKTVGWLSGNDTPAMRTLFNGFGEGVKLADPEVKIAQAVTGTFTDGEAAASKAVRLAENGADVIVLASGAGNTDARKALEKYGTYIINLDKPAPGGVATIAKAADKAVYEIVKSFASGNFRGKEIVVYDLANGGVSLDGLESFIVGIGKGGDIARRAGELRHELSNGSIRLRSLRARTLCDCLD